MVRLEAAAAYPTKPPGAFQFLYGAIGSRFDYDPVTGNACFNSYMVRLEVKLGMGMLGSFRSFNSYMVRLEADVVRNEKPFAKCFNSYMVRLEVQIRGRRGNSCSVSIPIWCDWKLSPQHQQPNVSLFQFLYGAIGSANWSNVAGRRISFNSYMVRLEVCIFRYTFLWSCVSIPIWCDWKDYFLF